MPRKAQVLTRAWATTALLRIASNSQASCSTPASAAFARWGGVTQTQERCLSGGQVDVEREIKSKMRQLYKRVHPDLFHDYPEAKEENEKSFKLLQQFISDSNTQYGDRRAHMFQFKFYLKSKTNDSTQGSKFSGATAVGDLGSLQLVDVALQQPRFMKGWDGHETGINPELTPALNKLLRACGLTTIDVTSAHQTRGEPENSRGRQFGFDSSLKAFLPYAVEEWQKLSISSTQLGKLDAMRSALRLFRGVIVTCSNDLKDAPLAEACLTKLVQILDGDHSLNLRGVKFVLDREFKISAAGAIHVDINKLSSKESWIEYIAKGGDLVKARVRSKVIEEVRIIEDQVASTLGIASIHCVTKVLVSRPEDCKLFLEQMGMIQRGEGVWGTDTCKPVKIVVDSGEECRVNQHDGSIMIPVTQSLENVLAFIKGNISEALLVTMKYDKDLKELDRLKSVVRSRLKLRLYSKDDRVTIHQFRQCSNRLVRMSKSLVCHTEDIKLRVSDENRIQKDYIDIAWDFAT